MTTKPFTPPVPLDLEPARNVGEDHIDQAIAWIAGDIPANLWADARARIYDVLENVRERAQAEPQTWTVWHITNTTTGAATEAGHVEAGSYDTAVREAKEAGLLPLHQSFRITQATCECYLECGSCSHSGEWHTHEDEPCPVHPDATMVG